MRFNATKCYSQAIYVPWQNMHRNTPMVSFKISRIELCNTVTKLDRMSPTDNEIHVHLLVTE
jgi:hypothetical protein